MALTTSKCVIIIIIPFGICITVYSTLFPYNCEIFISKKSASKYYQIMDPVVTAAASGVSVII